MMFPIVVALTMSVTILMLVMMLDIDLSSSPIILFVILTMPLFLGVMIWNLFDDVGFRGRTVRTLSLSNIEERTKEMQKLGIEKMLKKMKAQPLNVSLRGNSLYLIDSLIPNYELKYLVYTDPSSPKKIYGCFVPSHFNTADEAMAWKFYITEEEYTEDLKFEA